jgi:hypothetical protein
VKADTLVLFPNVFWYKPVPVQKKNVSDIFCLSDQFIKLLLIMSPHKSAPSNRVFGRQWFMPGFGGSEYAGLFLQSVVPRLIVRVNPIAI